MSLDTVNRPIERVKVHFGRGERGAVELRLGEAPPQTAIPEGRVPRVARMMALAIKIDRWVRSGEVRDMAEAARLGGVTRARMTQIMNLLNLCPEIQSWLLCLSPVKSGYDPVSERDVRESAAEMDWSRQRAMLRSRGLALSGRCERGEAKSHVRNTG